MPLALTTVETVTIITDIVLIVFFVLSTVVLIGIAVVGFKLYRSVNRVVQRADTTVSRVESMVRSVDSTVSAVRKAAMAVDLGVKAGGFARSAASTVSNTVFKRGGDSKGGHDGGGERARDGRTEATSKS